MKPPLERTARLGMRPEALDKGMKTRMKKPWHVQPSHRITVLDDRCTACGLCIGCAYEALDMEVRPVAGGPEHVSNERRVMAPETAHEAIGKKWSEGTTYESFVKGTDSNCVGCDWCVAVCPEDALIITDFPRTSNHSYWDNWSKDNIRRQANTGAKLLASMGAEGPTPGRPTGTRIFDHLRFDAAQVTNPSIDPLREPMEVRTFLGPKPTEPDEPLPDLVELRYPFMLAHMSFGALSPNAHMAMAMAAKELGIVMGTGEGGLLRSIRDYGSHIVVQVASGRFGVDVDYLNAGRAVGIKIGQGAKPGIGGHLPGGKVNALIAETRGIPVGHDAISPAPQHDIYSIEDLRQLIYAIKEATNYKPVEVKIAATHHCDFIASGIARAGADWISVDGYRGSTGAALEVVRDHTGTDIEIAISKIDLRLRSERVGKTSLRDRVSLIASGGIKNAADALKCILLGADAVAIGTSVLETFGCTTCGTCHTNRCNYGITTQDPNLYERLDPEVNAKRIVNLVKAWSHEMKEFLGSMGLSTIEGARGNRERLRGAGLQPEILEALGVKAV